VQSSGRGPVEDHVPREPSTSTPARARRPDRFGRGERGQAVVEFALVIPLLMLLLMGIFRCGVIYNNYIQLTNAVDVGARQLAEERGQTSPCTDAAGAADNVAAGLTTSSMTLSMSQEGASPYVYPAETGSCPSLVAGDYSTMSGTYPCNLSIMGVNFDPGCTLTASATEIVQ
jgi:Flp pilus assembly protein TadG